MSRVEGDAMVLPLRIVAVAFLGIMVWMLADPFSFHRNIAAFGDPNTHFIRDAATFGLPLAAALWMAATRLAWRGPVLVLALVQNGLHILNHLWDVGASNPGGHGPANLVALAAMEVALWQLYRYYRSREQVTA